MASTSPAGGSMTIPPTMIQTLTPIAAANIAYCATGANGDFTAKTEQANPAIRSANTARIAPPIEKFRL